MDWDRFKSDDTMGSTHYTLQPPYKTDIWLPLDTQGKLHVAFNAYEPTQSYSQFQYGQHGIAVRAVTDTTPTLHGVQSFNPGAFAQNINMMEFDRLRPKTLSATDGNYLSGSYYASQWGLNIPYRGAPASVP
ncbi:C2 domain-containing protein [Entamoeba marina]